MNSLAELCSQYALSNSIITGWLKKTKPVGVDKNTTLTVFT